MSNNATLFWLFFAVLVLSGTCHGELTMRLSARDDDGLSFDWELRNELPSSGTVNLLAWLLPVGRLHADILAVEPAGVLRSAGYRGKLRSDQLLHCHWPAGNRSDDRFDYDAAALGWPTDDDKRSARCNFVQLHPGDSLRGSVDVAANFLLVDRAASSLTVRFVAPLARLLGDAQPLPDAHGEWSRVAHVGVDTELVWVKSNDVSLLLRPDDVARFDRAAHRPGVARAISGCTTTQAAMLGSPSSGIIGNTASSVGSCLANLNNQLADALYAKWFGAANYLNQVTGIMNSVKNLYSSGSANYVCENCASTIGSAQVYAYVYPTDSTHTVHLCNELAFSGQNTMTHWDCVPGVLLHEGSHFFTTVDHGYGTSYCTTTAAGCLSSGTNCDQPPSNADCFEYYCEDYCYSHTC